MSLFNFFGPKATKQAPSVATVLADIAMIEVQDTGIARICSNVPESERSVFMNAYAAYILWIIERKSSKFFSAAHNEQIRARILSAYSANEWFSESTLKTVLASIADNFPHMMLSKGRLSGTAPLPLTMLTMATKMAGLPFPMINDPEIALSAIGYWKQLDESVGKVCSAGRG
jgi:hypothetical protein